MKPLFTGWFFIKTPNPLKWNYSQGRTKFVKNLLPIKKITNISLCMGLTLSFGLQYSVLSQSSSVYSCIFYHFLTEAVVTTKHCRDARPTVQAGEYTTDRLKEIHSIK